MGKISERDLARKIADDLGNISYAKSEAFLKAFKERVLKEVARDNQVRLAGFGKFIQFVRHGRYGVDPQDMGRIYMPRIAVMKFVTGSRTKNFIKEYAKEREKPESE